MKGYTSVEEYFENHTKWQPELELLRKITFQTAFVETLKWGVPTYTINSKNVMGIGAFKGYVGLWFFNGCFLIDRNNKLINAQDGKTKGLRQLRFNSVKEMDVDLILAYMNEAIDNQKQGKMIKVERKSKEVQIPEALENAFKENEFFEKAFKRFTPAKQREFSEYISSAKRVQTKLTRLEKIIPMIIEEIGLHDKYK